MTEFQEKAILAIEAQQAKVTARSPQWMVGEQLKDICRMEPGSAELIAQDLENETMSRAWTVSNRQATDTGACIDPYGISSQQRG